ncbi:multiple epidermal growth factor-like domains protein 9 isoform X2 [Scleropages formosus]|uniref:multiple epidermal growth factor-like domains protein 9 isoform X2 n=1 Tax=Scleropages formosus TaxID=113540 RepID=UPI0010FA9CA9|nr:multiple epidermal growth factor-like domains protein 9 isoform X2 [Scleropages formosus]
MRELLCNCSGEGILDPEDCDQATGHCFCLPGYTGPQCEACEDGHFNNGSSGCLPCACDSFGAVSPLCDSTGTCMCKTGVYGPKCDDCHPGYFRFSSTGCQPCQCHNHSSYCHPQSGICLNCQGNTKGPGCEECKYNFYRRPGAAPTDVCVPCPCSTVTSTGSCHIDASGRPVCDQCRPEYEGPNCDRCRDGFYNSDSICLPCDCNGNADPQASPRICDPDTGRCLSCVNHTAGSRCERCAKGYSGDALAHNCTPIAVKILPAPDRLTSTTAATNSAAFSPAVPPASRTMTTRANSTSLPASVTTQAMVTSLSSPADNSTLPEVSWTQFNVIVLAVIIVVVVLLMGFVGGVYTYREYRNRKLNAPFWTIELKEDNISFSSYHDSLPNADVSGLLEDEASEVTPNGQLALSAPMNMYKA